MPRVDAGGVIRDDAGVRVAGRPGGCLKGAVVEGISKYLRLRMATLVAALVAAVAVLGAMSASASAVCLFGFCPKPVLARVHQRQPCPPIRADVSTWSLARPARFSR